MSKTEIIKVNSEQPELRLLKKAADVILNDGVIAYPTETVYGLGANAFSGEAIKKIYKLKSRASNKAVLIIAENLEQVKGLVSSFPDSAYKLTHEFWPGPLTLVFKASKLVNNQLLGDGNSIGIRIPASNICLELIRLCGVPLTSTSANISGGKNPVSIADVYHDFADQLDLMIDGGAAQSLTPSTVLDLTRDQATLRREGLISVKKIESIIGKIRT
jgi:L-threonylcarbamoyladenylate synthase